MSNVVLENAAFAYPSAPNRLVLKGLNAAISLEGHSLALGGNGAGKTALARLLAGLDSPAAGSVIWPRDNRPARDASLIRAGVVFAEPDFQFQGFSVRQELCGGLLYQGVPAPRADRLAEDVAERFGFDKLLDSTLDSLDYQAKLAVLVSSFLLLRPSLLVLDFSLAELDENFREKLLTACKEQKKPALMVLSRRAEDFYLLSGAALYLLNDGGLHELTVDQNDPDVTGVLRRAGIAMVPAGFPPLSTGKSGMPR